MIEVILLPDKGDLNIFEQRHRDAEKWDFVNRLLCVPAGLDVKIKIRFYDDAKTTFIYNELKKYPNVRNLNYNIAHEIIFEIMKNDKGTFF